MSTTEQLPVRFTLKGPDTDFQVLSMVLAGEMARLPVLLLMVSPSQPEAMVPALGSGPYELHAERGGGATVSFGVANWFVQSAAEFRRPDHQPMFCLRLGVLPGQHLPMRGHAADGLALSAVVQDVCNGYLGRRTVENRFPTGSDPVLGTVLSFSETLEQFLRRIALATDTWFWAADGGGTTLRLSWQPALHGAGTDASPELDWAAVRAAEERSSTPAAVRTFWPRSTISHAADSQAAPHVQTLERISPLPQAADSYRQDDAGGNWQARYFLSDNLSHACAWPGVRTGQEDVIIAAIHVYDQEAGDDVRRLLQQLVPGMRCADFASAGAGGGYGMVAISCKGGAGYAASMDAIERLQIARHVDAIGAAFGIPEQGLPGAVHRPPHLALATVCAWDPGISPTWAAGGAAGTAKHTTEIKVRFDWSEVPVRIPFAYPMSGSEGVAFYPPAAGDRVLVLFDRMWPILACNAYQCGDVLLPGVLRHGGDINTLSAQRGHVVKGSMILRTAENGDVVIHAAGNLVLRAEKDIFIDGRNLRENARAADGQYVVDWG